MTKKLRLYQLMLNKLRARERKPKSPYETLYENAEKFAKKAAKNKFILFKRHNAKKAGKCIEVLEKLYSLEMSQNYFLLDTPRQSLHESEVNKILAPLPSSCRKYLPSSYR